MSDEQKKAIEEIRRRLDLAHDLCCTLAPKQSVGELLYTILEMKEWQILCEK